MNERVRERVSPSARGARGPLAGAAFLMATSAVGPGFLTQTALFTGQLGASFGFAILLSVLLDLAAQLTVWRTLVAAGAPAPVVADGVRPGLGRALAAAVTFGGLAFNVGNVAGCGLGLAALAGVPPAWGAVGSAAVAAWLLTVPRAGKAMDRFTVLLGLAMLALLGWLVLAARPPLADAALRTVWPTRVDALAVLTIVGGTVGGYITFAGAHRLLDAGVRGPDALAPATRGAASGILLASAVRVALFLGALGVVAAGGALDPANPPASVFRLALGSAGGRAFGFLMWAAAITSVVGAAYTSTSFLRAAWAPAARRPRGTALAFVAVSTLVFLAVGRPVRALVLAGAVNALVLPATLVVMLLAARRPALVGGAAARRVLPGALQLGAALTAAATLVLAGRAVVELLR